MNNRIEFLNSRIRALEGRIKDTLKIIELYERFVDPDKKRQEEHLKDFRNRIARDEEFIAQYIIERNNIVE